MKRREIQLMAAVIAIAFGGCNRSAASPPPSPYASAEQIEMNFRGQSFSLGDDDKVAILTPAGGPKDRVLKLPFWLGTNILVPGVLQPKEGDYYVISEAVMVKTLDNPDEWLIEAGSTLIKKETVLVTTRTHFRPAGNAPPNALPKMLPKMLPMIVQFAGTRPFTRGDGKTIEIPVLKEVSLPMKWTLAGAIPPSYARFQVR